MMLTLKNTSIKIVTCDTAVSHYLGFKLFKDLWKRLLFYVVMLLLLCHCCNIGDILDYLCHVKTTVYFTVGLLEIYKIIQNSSLEK